jgi:AcrR family transcriptional regulator
VNRRDVTEIALYLFSRNGIKSVSMDSIARRANISKRTLYEYFEDKEALLSEALEYNYKVYVDLVNRLEQDSESVIDIVIYFYDEIMQMPRWYNQKFYEDLMKFPHAREIYLKQSEQFLHTLLSWFKKGVEEGVFQDDINFEIVVLLAKGYAKMIRPSHSFSRFSSREVYNTILLVFIRGICTEKGNKILDRHLRKKKYDLRNN